MEWLKRLWPVAGILALIAFLLGGREKKDGETDDIQTEYEYDLRMAAKEKRKAATRAAEDRRSAARRRSPADRLSGTLRRARERLRQDKRH